MAVRTIDSSTAQSVQMRVYRRSNLRDPTVMNATEYVGFSSFLAPQPLSVFVDDAKTHFDKLLRWIQLESDAETKRLAERRQRSSGEQVERSGEALIDLAIEDHQTGIGGRFLLNLVKRNRTLALPWNRFRVGSPVVLSVEDDPQNESHFAVVSARNRQAIQVAVNEWPDGDRFRLDLSADEVTRKRQREALAIALQSRGRLAELRGVLFGQRDPRFGKAVDCQVAADLNESQRAAIYFALTGDDVSIIHGPPGTGKTTTVVELIRLAVEREQKVLACAPSNTAVDNLLEKLVDVGVNAVRIGHPARVDQHLRDRTLDALVETHENMRWVRELMKEAEQLYRQAGRFTRAKPTPGSRQELRREAKQLKLEARTLERQAVDHILDRAEVVCATTTFDRDVIGQRWFDLAVIDEACQSTEPGCWVPLLNADRLVLAGDHCQLPPTVISPQAAREGFGRSLLERLVAHYGDTVTRQLDVQYRMHDQIMQFSSREFYDSTLIADPQVAGHVLADLPDVAAIDVLTTEPVTFIDTAGAGYEEELEPDGESRRNPAEGNLALRKLSELRDAGLRSREIGVITPYAAQVRWLRENTDDPHLEIDTVDGFQGREKEAILISLVRCNQRGEIGFLADTRRMNVALTRARRKLIVVGDSATLAGHDFYAALLEYFEQIGAYHTVWEEDVS